MRTLIEKLRTTLFSKAEAGTETSADQAERREALLRKQRALSKQMKAAGTHLLTGHKYSRNTTNLERNQL